MMKLTVGVAIQDDRRNPFGTIKQVAIEAELVSLGQFERPRAFMAKLDVQDEYLCRLDCAHRLSVSFQSHPYEIKDIERDGRARFIRL